MDWILANKEWIFSGVGIFIIGVIMNIFNKKKSEGNGAMNLDNVTNSGYIAGGDITINNSSNNQELIELLKHRAERINRDIGKYYKYVSIQKYLVEFNKLHLMHIKALEDNKPVLAHEYLNDIHKLSFKLESDEFWTESNINSPDVCYSLCPDAFQNGYIVKEYDEEDKRGNNSVEIPLSEDVETYFVISDNEGETSTKNIIV